MILAVSSVSGGKGRPEGHCSGLGDPWEILGRSLGAIQVLKIRLLCRLVNRPSVVLKTPWHSETAVGGGNFLPSEIRPDVLQLSRGNCFRHL